MQYRKLGQTQLVVSILGLGTMRLPIANVDPDFSKATSIIRYAIEKGINFFDVGTFYCHGHCETAFGLAIRDKSEQNLIIAGKNSSHQNNDDGWQMQLRNSLCLFRRDHMDIYFLHYLNTKDWQNYYLGKKIVDQVMDAQNKGLFTHLGFSSHDTPENVRELIDSDMFQAVMLPFSLLNRAYEETMKYAFEKGLGVIAMNPLAAGALAHADLFVDKLARIPQSELASMALNYVISQPFIHCAFSGMESGEIIDANVRTVNRTRFSQDKIEELNTCISREKANRYIPCTGCQYCMPCTQGIDIPAVINILNQYSVVGGEMIHHREYSMLSNPAECCIHCDNCRDKCPQKLAIPELISRAGDLFRS